MTDDGLPRLRAELRKQRGKNAARLARSKGEVPGIVYGGGSDPLPVTIQFNELLIQLRSGRFMNTLFNLRIDGKDDVRVICRGIQRDAVKQLPTHIDLMRLRKNSRVSLFIPVEFVNSERSEGIQKGGKLVIVRNEIELNVLAGEIPEKLVVDLENMSIGKTILASEISLPKGAKFASERASFAIATIVAPPPQTEEDDNPDEPIPALGELAKSVHSDSQEAHGSETPFARALSGLSQQLTPSGTSAKSSVASARSDVVSGLLKDAENAAEVSNQFLGQEELEQMMSALSNAIEDSEDLIREMKKRLGTGGSK